MSEKHINLFRATAELPLIDQNLLNTVHENRPSNDIQTFAIGRLPGAHHPPPLCKKVDCRNAALGRRRCVDEFKNNCIVPKSLKKKRVVQRIRNPRLPEKLKYPPQMFFAYFAEKVKNLRGLLENPPALVVTAPKYLDVRRFCFTLAILAEPQGAVAKVGREGRPKPVPT